MASMTMADWQTLSERINRVAPSATPVSYTHLTLPTN